MSAGQNKERLGNYAKVQGGYAYPSASFISVGVPVLKIQNIRWRDVSTDDLSYVPIELAQETARFYVEYGDVLISMTGSWATQPNSVVGRVARFTGESNSYLINQRVGRFIITRPEELDSRFLFFTLCDPDYQDELVSGAGGSANQANISGAQIETLKIPIPPIDEQRAIARILGALDDKITLNRQMNHTLEAMGQSLFLSWFVDFDPVTAKAGGRKPYGMNEETAALIPERFMESKLGLIPEGWQIAKIKDVAEFLYGKSLTETKRQTGPVPVFGSDGQVGWHNKALAASAGIIVGRKGNAGKVNWSETPFFPIDTTFYVAPTSAHYGLRFLYQLLRAVDLENVSGDSAVPGLNRDLAYSLEMIIPPVCLAAIFERLIEPTQKLIAENTEQSRILSALRDTLWPKLLSGQIPVRQAENLVAEAV